MRKIYILTIFFLLLSVPKAWALYFPIDEAELSLDLPDEMKIQEIKKPFPLLPKSFARKRFLVNDSVEILLSELDTTNALEQLKFRVINTESVSNRETSLGTAVEITGKGLSTDQDLNIVLLPLKKFLLVVIAPDTSKNFDTVLQSFQKLSGFVDTVAHPLKKEIEEALARGLFKGYTDPKSNTRTFLPDSPINRAEFMKIVVLASGITPDQLAKIPVRIAPFKDSDVAAWYTPYLSYAKSQGWIKGHPDGSFRPGERLNMAEAVKIIIKSKNINAGSGQSVPSTLAGSPEQAKSPKDVNVKSEPAILWFQPFFDYFVEKGVLIREGEQYSFGKGDSKFFPHENCTRAQAAGLLVS